MNGAGAMLDLLGDWGVEQVFTCPGSTEAAFLDAAVDHPRVDVVLTTHESIAVSMADGVARASGKPAVAYLHANVGLTNGLSHLYAAQLGHSPVVVLNGMKSRSIQNRGGFTTASSMRDLVRQYVKWDWQVLIAEALVEDVNRALKISLTEPQGPTWIGISEDLFRADAPPMFDPARYQVSGSVRPAPRDLEMAASLLAKAERPLIVAGADVARHGAVDALVRLADRLGCPVVGEDRRVFERVGFPDDHPSYAGLYGATRACLLTADVILLAGARSFREFAPPSTPELPPDAAIIHLHADAEEMGRIYGLDVALVGDTTLALEGLLGRVERGEISPTRTAFVERCRAEQAKLLAQVLPTEGPAGTSISVPHLARMLAGLVDRDTSVVVDATTSGHALLQALPKQVPQHVYSTCSGSLGWGVGAALGLQVAQPSRRVIAVLGDGGMQFGLQGLWTAAYYDIPALFVVINNQSYAAVGAALRRYGGEAFTEGRILGVDLSGPRLSDIAAGFGLETARIDDLEDLPVTLRKLQETRRPALLEVMTDPTDLGP